MEENRFNILIEKLVSEKIPDKIDIDSINNLFEIIENCKPIPIEYYTKNLVELSKTSNKKCDLDICKRKAVYTDSHNCYCWFHCQ